MLIGWEMNKITHTHTHTRTHLYIYIYIYWEKEKKQTNRWADCDMYKQDEIDINGWKHTHTHISSHTHKHTHTHTHIHIYNIYIYIYIYIYNVPYPYMNMRNIHGMFIHIYIEHTNLEIRKTRNDFSVQVRNFLLLLSLKVFRHKEREAQSFYSGFFICPPPHLVRHQPKASASKRKPTVFPPRQVSSQLTDFFKISQNPPHASGPWRHSPCVTPFPISGYCDISEWHVRSTRVRVNICVNVAPK